VCVPMVSRECAVCGQNHSYQEGLRGIPVKYITSESRSGQHFGQYGQQSRLNASHIRILFSFNIYVEIEKCIGDNSANSGCNLFGKRFSDSLKLDTE